MRNKKILLIVFLFTMLASFNLAAQSYATAFGLRMANDKNTRLVGLTFQHRIFPKITLEGIVQSDFANNTTFHAMIERHRGFLTKRFNLYTGLGFSFGTEESRIKDPLTNEIITTYGNKTIGTDVVFGVEATLMGLNVALDYKPNFNLKNREPWYLGQAGVSVRAVVATGRKQNKRKRKRKRARKKRENKRKDAKKEKRNKEEPWLKDLYEKVFKKT